jgi:hypothetical protein
VITPEDAFEPPEEEFDLPSACEECHHRYNFKPDSPGEKGAIATGPIDPPFIPQWIFKLLMIHIIPFCSSNSLLTREKACSIKPERT